MNIQHMGSRPVAKGSAEWFTGSVQVEPLFQSPGPAPVAGASVTFEPGARSAWHTHPCGQTLIVTSGLGWTQCEGEPKQEIRPGNVVTCPPGKKHWHGATDATAMTHIAIQVSKDGKAVEWLEKVTDEQYLGRWQRRQKENIMANETPIPHNPFADIAPALADYTDNVLFGDVWKRMELSPRDRSLVTVACLVALYRVNEMPFHFKRALDNGVTRAELIEAITHLAFYAGWPVANTALTIARRVFEEAGV
ncbi:MAG: (R)-mandelonitrile lyase [Rhodanobacteraceae bacterium]